MDYKTPVKKLYGVGEKIEKSLHSGGFFTVKDLLYHFPRAYQNRADVRLLADEDAYGEYHSYVLTIANEPKAAMIKRGMNLLKFRAFDESGSVNITYFNQNYLKDVFHQGATFRFWGKATKEKRTISMTSPSYEPVLPMKELDALVPVYPLFSGINQKFLIKLMREIVSSLPEFVNDFLPTSIREKNNLPTLTYALENIHFPSTEEALEKAIKRLTFDELYIFALALSKIKTVQSTQKAPRFEDTDISPLLKLIPYTPTGAQMRAINEIALDTCPKNDDFHIKPMNRILVGDVGSGKTLCATAGAYIACKNGYQCALMAPTEILANQHFESISPLFNKLGISCELLTGSTSAKGKKTTLSRLKSGECKFVIGTHALIQDSVEFNNLALAITDEQHRFGANQRSSLSDKGVFAHTLVMSATPIPRTLSFMMYGDLDISLIDEMPPGREKVSTYVVDESYRQRLNAFIRKQVDEGGQVYIVCPSVEERKEDIDNVSDYDPFSFFYQEAQPPLKSAVDYAEKLSSEVFPDLNISFIHGKLKGKEKDAIMSEFSLGNIDILVSTTVIEVGVNVPNASLMIVENAERFGLSQLHQLRGRVGRGSRKSHCVLVSDSKGETARERLNIIKTLYDGYSIAEKDLEMRGPGDFFSSDSSVRQSGQLELGIAKSCKDSALVFSAFESAKQTLDEDPELSSNKNALLLQMVEEICNAKANTIN
ncbi:MAG: ATP-dependent DNA helicase RecG [Ruminococcaceae bacterium]|nr:ATP-dependent DNA helicase RecG [Oscillospiraceae bacterium]